MQSMFSEFLSSTPAAEDAESGSLLREWNSYATVTPAAQKLAATPASSAAPAASTSSGEQGRPNPFAGFASRLQSGISNLQNLTALDVQNDVRQMATNAASKAREAAAELKDFNVKATAGNIGDKAKAAAAVAGQKAKAATEKLETASAAGIQKAAAGLQQAGGAIKEGFQEGVTRLQTLSQERLILFISLMASGGTLLLLAFFVGLPAAALAPAKFAIPFTLGSICNMVALASLRGYKAQVVHMMARERLPFSTLYVGSMLATLWATFVMHSYALCVMFSMVQIVSLAYYMFSYFPGGIAGLKIVSMSVARILKPVIGACTQCLIGGGPRDAVSSLLPI